MNRLKLSDKDLVNIRTNRIRLFLLDYFENGSPATYTIDGNMQCGKGRCRTFNDICSLVKNYFSSATKKKIAYILFKLIKEYSRRKFIEGINSIKIGSINCSSVGGATFGTEYYYFTPFEPDFDKLNDITDRDMGCKTALSFDDVEKLAISYENSL